MHGGVGGEERSREALPILVLSRVVRQLPGCNLVKLL